MNVRRTLAMSLRPGLGNVAWQTDDAALMQRVELVLSTPLKTIAWRPDFGCSIWNMLGLPATQAQLAAVRWGIEEAIARWVPMARVHQCVVALVPDLNQAAVAAIRSAQLSPIEMGMLHLGVSAGLRIELTLGLQDGAMKIQFDFGT